jgi:hypothetical protein
MFFCYLDLNGHLHHFSKTLSHKKSHKTVGFKVFLKLYCLDPVGPKTYGSGSATLFGFIYRETFYFLILRINFLKEISVMLVFCLPNSYPYRYLRATRNLKQIDTVTFENV